MNRTKCKVGFCLIFIVFFCAAGLQAQTIKLENGIAFTSLKGNENIDLGTMHPYQMSLGISYFDKGWFNLSSQVGYIRKGGYDKIFISTEGSAIPYSYVKLKEGADYLTLNTTFQLKRMVRNETYYIGAGPRVDFKVNDLSPYTIIADAEHMMQLKSESVLWGLKCEVGFDYTINKILLGINASYLPSFNKQIDPGYDLSYRDQTFTLGFVIGYVL